MEPELEQAIGIRIRKLRLEKGLTLDDLATASGVSRAMISRIERAEASPTASLLARICAALGLSLSAFFAEEGQEASPLARRQEQQVWRDPETGYIRRVRFTTGHGLRCRYRRGRISCRRPRQLPAACGEPTA